MAGKIEGIPGTVILVLGSVKTILRKPNIVSKPSVQISEIRMDG